MPLPMDIALLVTAPPARGRSALAFARAAVAGGHAVPRVFFYRDGVHVLDDRALAAEWADLADATGADLVVCVGAAQRRAVVDAQGHAAGVPDAFSVSGLGQLVEATLADRLVTFSA